MAGEIDLDLVLERIMSDDPDMIMPPPKINKPLKPNQVDTLSRWIEQGGEFEQHWAYVSPSKPDMHKFETQAETGPSAAWGEQPIDQLVLHRLTAALSVSES